MPPEIQDVVQRASHWERLAAVAIVLGVALLTWLIARFLARRLHGTTQLGLHALERLPAPLSMIAAVATALAITASRPGPTPPLLAITLEVLAVAAGFWLAARIVDVVWATGKASARLRAHPGSGSALLAGRHAGKLLLVAGAVTVIAVRLGASEQLYLVLTGLAAALAFAARDPIRNAVAFGAMVLDPPFRLGDRVRLVDFRGGEEVVGEVMGISLTGTTVRTKARTHVFVSNVSVGTLRVENLSVADRRRLELALPISSALRAAEVRGACDAIEADLRASPLVSGEREPHVWVSGRGGGLTLKASFWLRRGLERREAQREIVLAMRARLEPHERERAERDRAVPARAPLASEAR